MSKTLVIKIIIGTASLGTLVAADVLQWGLSTMVAGMLGAAAGWVVRFPIDGDK